MAMGDSVPDLELDEIMEKIRAEVEMRRIASSAPAPVQASTFSNEHPFASPISFETPHLNLDQPFATPKEGSLNFRGLACYHDAVFVANAYRALLRREPDQPGLSHYLSELRAGRLTKAEIVWGIRHSAEGMASAVPLTGILRPLLMVRAFNLPVLGPLFHWFYSICTLHRKLNHMGMMETTLYAREAILARQLNAAFASISEAVNSQRALLDVARQAFEKSSADARAAHDDLGSRAAKNQAAIDAIRAELAERDRALVAHQTSAREAYVGVTQEMSRLAAEQISARNNRAQLAESLEKFSADARAAHDDLGSRTAKLETAIRPLERSLVLRTDDRFYADLEGAFRGTEELIKSRAGAYLPFIEKALAGTPGRAVIDLGCGRGEWLELMKSHDLEGIGVDQNNLFIETLRDKNIAAEKGDLLEFLQGRRTGSAGAVTGIHILEHLSFSYLIDVLTETTRVLAPGGVAIFETPNPANLPVGAHTFYLDPTHLKPIPPALLAFLVERAGLMDVETVEIHPPPLASLPKPGSGLPPELMAHFASPQDYFVAGWKR